MGPLPPTQATVNGANSVVCEGWVLKKRRKKMQGFARRYFILHPSGVLSYSFEPGQPVRDKVSLHHAAISTEPGRKDIHIDSNTATFHIKCLSMDDFQTWMLAFRRFIIIGSEARKSASVRLMSRGGPSKFGVIIDEIGSTLVELEDAILAVKQEHISKKPHSVSKKSEKDKHKDLHHSKFGIFKKSPNHSSVNEFGVESGHVDLHAPLDQPQPPIQRVQAILEILKSQHAHLKATHGPTSGDPNHPVRASPLPFTAEEERSERFAPFSVSNPRPSKRNSIATTISDSVSEYLDALEGISDGAQEYVMDAHNPLANDSRSSLSQSGDSSADTDVEDRGVIDNLQTDKRTLQVSRRTQLPSSPVGDEGSLFTILKNNVGKDLSTIALPVTFNEPLTLLQRAAEEMEYYDLLNDAVRASDPIDRICQVAAFAVSSYAHTRHRSGRKGFNPMLGETFEDIRMKFIAEKVRHNPLEMAYHAEGEHWELSATSSGKTKFWGKSLEIIPLGSTSLKIGDDHYVWNKPSSFMRNIMVGTKYLEHSGKMIIENKRNDIRCVLEFKQNSYWTSSNVVSGTVHASTDNVICHLEGKWDDQMAQATDSSHLRVLWRMSPYPKNTLDYYGFTSFGMTLNELTDDIVGKLPPTDSRYRPDVRALENGDLDVAEEQKMRIEEMQRERRRQGLDRQPKWFKQVGGEWIYTGGYWEARARDWQDEGIQALWINHIDINHLTRTRIRVFIMCCDFSPRSV